MNLLTYFFFSGYFNFDFTIYKVYEMKDIVEIRVGILRLYICIYMYTYIMRVHTVQDLFIAMVNR